MEALGIRGSYVLFADALSLVFLRGVAKATLWRTLFLLESFWGVDARFARGWIVEVGGIAIMICSCKIAQ